MPKDDMIEMEGVVIDVLRNTIFRVKLENDHVIVGPHPAGRRLARSRGVDPERTL